MHARFFMLAAIVAAVLTGCAAGGGPQPTFDRQFIDMMVPHHQGAVEMARIAQARGQRPEVTELAAAIIRAQEDEIARLKGWRRAWFGSDQTPPLDKMPMVPGMGGGHAMGERSGGTMDMAADVESLRQAGEPFDRAFIDAMIPHHESAIAAAKAAETRAERPEIKTLAKAIIADQQREIEQMKAWRAAWFGAAASRRWPGARASATLGRVPPTARTESGPTDVILAPPRSRSLLR
jgi:uncharacterized protein (DUF305 family)